MQIAPFKLERYFAKFEFKVKYLLSPSDCESLSMRELLQIADSDSLTLWNELRLGYTESPGHPALRTEVSRLYQTITPDNVVIAAPEEAILIALQTLLKPADRLILKAWAILAWDSWVVSTVARTRSRKSLE